MSTCLHVIRKLIGEKPFKCKECDNSFIQKVDLACRQRTHNGEKLCKCDQFNNIVHLKVVLYVICQWKKRCFIVTKLTCNQKTHIGEKIFKCKECDNSFVQKVKLACHLRIQNGEKLCKCDQCYIIVSDQ